MNAYETYQEAEILSADPVRLIELLYEGAVEAVRKARFCLSIGDIAERTRAVTKAQEIIAELVASLDRERGGEFSRNLVELYAYVLGRLAEGNFAQVDQPFAEAERLLCELLDGWRTLKPAEPSGPAALYGGSQIEAEHICCSF